MSDATWAMELARGVAEVVETTRVLDLSGGRMKRGALDNVIYFTSPDGDECTVVFFAGYLVAKEQNASQVGSH